MTPIEPTNTEPIQPPLVQYSRLLHAKSNVASQVQNFMMVACLIAMVGSAAAVRGQSPAQKASAPQAVEAFRNAVALQNRELYDLAAEEWTSFIDQFAADPLASKATYYRGVCRFQLGEFAAAATDFEPLTRLPKFEFSEQAFANLGLARYNLAQNGDIASRDHISKTRREAIDALTGQLKRFPNGTLVPQALFYLAESHYADADLLRAAKRYQPFVDGYREHPLRPQALYGLAVVQQELDQQQEAAKTLDQFLASYPKHESAPDASLRRGEVSLALGNYAKAEERFAFVATLPNQPDADYALDRQAECRVQLKNYRGAADLYQTLVQKFPHSRLAEPAIDSAGKYRLLAGDAVAAVTWLKQSPQTTDESAHWLARALIDSGKPGEAIEVVMAALATQKKSPWWWELQFDQADAMFAIAERRKDAAALYATLAQSTPPHANRDQASYMAALASLNVADYGSARRLASEFLSAFPKHELSADIQNIAAEANLQLGNHAVAAKGFQTLAAKFPEREEKSGWIGRAALAHSLAKDWPPVIDLLASAWTTLPDDERRAQAGLLLAKAYRATDDNTQAVATLEKLLQSSPPARVRSDALYLRGMCEAGFDHHSAAEETYATLLKENPTYAAADRVLYELAWARLEAGKPNAINTFRRVAKEHPKSPLAAECWYRVGESQYEAEESAAAVKSFVAAKAIATDAGLREKASHKLAWSYFQQEEFVKAEKEFQQQMEQYPTGPLVTDAELMVAESLFGQQDYGKALPVFHSALESETSNHSLQALSMLHAGQSALQLNNWNQGLAMFERCCKEYPDCEVRDQVEYERGWALYKLERFDEAQKVLDTLADQQRTVLGARARFVAGEVQFAKKEYDAAVRTFFKVAYGYGDRDAPVEFHPWQAEAMFEAARCLQLTGRTDSSAKLFRELIERFPDSEKANHARNQLP